MVFSIDLGSSLAGYHKPLETTYIGPEWNLLTKPNTRQGLLQTWQIQTLFPLNEFRTRGMCVQFY